MSKCLTERLYFYILLLLRLICLIASLIVDRSLFISEKETLSMLSLIIVVEDRVLRIVVIEAVLEVLMTIVVVVIVRLAHVAPHKLSLVL